jgi:hypothetical protein
MSTDWIAGAKPNTPLLAGVLGHTTTHSIKDILTRFRKGPQFRESEAGYGDNGKKRVCDESGIGRRALGVQSFHLPPPDPLGPFIP